MPTYRTLKRSTQLVAVLLAIVTAFALVTASSASPSERMRSLPASSDTLDLPGSYSVATVATAAEAAASTSATAQPGDGVIMITIRVCGSSAGWQNVAAANGISPPVYLVLLGQRLNVTCQGAAPAPPAPPAGPASSALWANPAPGVCHGDDIGAGRGHEGIDLAAQWGAPIYAAASGVVVSRGWSYYGGNDLAIRHGGGTVWTTYMHAADFSVGIGAQVTVGQQIGRVGNTGPPGMQAHLHFEVNTRGPYDGPTSPLRFMLGAGITWPAC